MSQSQGFLAEIFPGLWKRLVTYGIPHGCFMVWAASVVMQLAMGFTLAGGAGVVGALLLGVVEFFGMQWLTTIDIQWDERMLSQVTRRYRRFYGAG